MTSHKRRPLPNWVIAHLDAITIDLTVALREYDEMLDKLERGDATVAGIALARMGRRISNALREAQTARHSKQEGE
jgi:hypothetical protein